MKFSESNYSQTGHCLDFLGVYLILLIVSGITGIDD